MKKIALVTLLALLVAGCAMRHAGDESLIEQYNSSKPTFDRIRELIAKDNRTVVLYTNSDAAKTRGVPPAHVEEYRRILGELKARSLEYHSGTQGTIVIELSKVKHTTSIDISTKGYVWLSKEPAAESLSNDLSRIEPDQPVMYRPVADGWYLFTRRRN